MTADTIARVINGILDREKEGDPAKGYLAKNDRGGRTSWGISEKAHPDVWKNGAPSRDTAYRIYDREYVSPWVWIDSDMVAEQVIDCHVLHGQSRAAKLLQRAIGVDPDGSIGEMTKCAVLAAAPFSRHLNNALVAFRLLLIDQITDADISQRVNDEGWQNRALSFLR